MKKKLLSIILAIAMLACMIPLGMVTAFAASADDLGEVTGRYDNGDIYFDFSGVEDFWEVVGNVYRGEDQVDVSVDYDCNSIKVSEFDAITGIYELRLSYMEWASWDGPSSLDGYVLQFLFNADTKEVKFNSDPELMYDSYSGGVMNFTVLNCKSVTVTGDVTVSYAGELSAATTVTADQSLYTVTNNTFSFRVKNSDDTAIAGISDIPGTYTVKLAELTLVTDFDETITVELEGAYGIDKDYSYKSITDFNTIFGSGTEADPYLIATDKELEFYRSKVGQYGEDKYQKANYLLRADVTVTSYSAYDSYMPKGFNGCFDGAGHTVNVIFPLFGHVDSSGIVRNLKLTGNISVDIDNIGAVCSSNYGLIENCVNYADVTSTKEQIGGICGYNKGTIRNCTNFGKIDCNSYVGGICGYNHNGGIIQSCVNMGTINTTSSASNIGGVCGYNRNGSSNTAKIENCISTVAVTSGSRNIGGLVGNNESGTVTNCFYNNTSKQNSNGTPLSEKLMTAEAGTSGALIDLLNNYTESGSYPAGWLKWAKDEGGYPYLPFYVGCDSTVGGKVTVNNATPAKYNVNNYFAKGDTVTLTVTADEGYQLKSLVWNDGTKSYDITEAKSFIMPKASVTVTAAFEEVPPADYTALNNAISVADEITDSTAFTAESWAKFYMAKKAAKDIESGLDITHQEEINAAAEALAAATEGLSELSTAQYNMIHEITRDGRLMARQGLIIGDAVSDEIGRTIIPITQEQLDSIVDYIWVVGFDGNKDFKVKVDCAYTWFYNMADGTAEKVEAEAMGYAAFIIIDNDGTQNDDNTITGFGYYRIYNGDDCEDTEFMLDALYLDPQLAMIPVELRNTAWSAQIKDTNEDKDYEAVLTIGLDSATLSFDGNDYTAPLAYSGGLNLIFSDGGEIYLTITYDNGAVGFIEGFVDGGNICVTTVGDIVKMEYVEE